jgi:transposase
MPRPIPVPVRRIIFRRWEQGQTAGQIAAVLSLPRATVRRLIRRFRQRGEGGLEPDYRRTSHASASGLSDAVLRYRREHPLWGAELIRIHLLRQTWDEPVPSARTLQRWLLRAGLAPAPAGRPAKDNPARATMPHQTWEMDAKELIKIATGDLLSWLRLVDECSGAVLRTAVFPPREMESSRTRSGPGATAARLLAVGLAREHAS